MMLGTNNIKGFINFLETYPRDILVYRLTLLLLVFYHPPAWIGEVPVRVSALFMFFSPKLSRNRWLWVLLFIAYSIFAARYWYYIDNHQYLITYWVGVCFISTLFKNRIQVLKINAHLLIVLTFLFALFWKFTSPYFLTGDFMQYHLLTDFRMQYINTALVGNTPEQFLDKKLLLKYLSIEPTLNAKITLDNAPRLHTVAMVMTYLTLIIELLVLLSFSLKNFPLFQKTKDYVLQAFILALYTFIPVTGFGFILAILGIAQLEPGEKKKFGLYFLAIIVMQLASHFSILDIVSRDLSV